jgi:outer membrane protein assembly factor BamB
MTAVGVEPVIDLGYVRATDGTPGPPPPGAGRRAVALTAIVVALLAAGGAAVPLPTLTAVELPETLVASSFAAAGDRLYRTTSPDPGADDAVWTLTAHTLPDGSELWHAPYDVPGGRIYAVTDAGPVVVVVGGSTVGRQLTTAAFDATSGRPLWTVEGDVVVADDRRTGLWTGGPTPRLNGIDLGDGRPLWSEPLNARVSVEPRPDGVLVLGRGGLVQLRDPRTGAVVRSATPFGDGVAPIASLTVGGSTVLWFVGAAGTGVAALDPETFAVRWRKVHPVDGGGFARCGPYVCVSGYGGVDALDPLTGATAWRAEDTRYVVDFGTNLLVMDSVPGGIGPVRTVEPATGAPVDDVRGWRTGSSAGGGPPVLSRTLPGDSRTALAFLGPPTGVLRPLGFVPEVVLGCQGALAAVVCRTPDGELRVWGLDRAELAFTRA